MLTLKNGIRVLLDHVTWYSLRYDKIKDKWLLQFGYAGGDKTFVSYDNQTEADAALTAADVAMVDWLRP